MVRKSADRRDGDPARALQLDLRPRHPDVERQPPRLPRARLALYAAGRAAPRRTGEAHRLRHPAHHGRQLPHAPPLPHRRTGIRSPAPSRRPARVAQTGPKLGSFCRELTIKLHTHRYRFRGFPNPPRSAVVVRREETFDQLGGGDLDLGRNGRRPEKTVDRRGPLGHAVAVDHRRGGRLQMETVDGRGGSAKQSEWTIDGTAGGWRRLSTERAAGPRR